MSRTFFALLMVFAALCACSSETKSSAGADASVCPTEQPSAASPCTLAEGTSCVYGSCTIAATRLVCHNGVWDRGGLTERCDGG